MASSQDAWYLSLLGLAEHFRTSDPPMIKFCVQCLQAVFNFKPPPRVEARTHLQLGNILLAHTKNIDLAKTHLEQAWMLSQMINSFDDVKFEAASVLAELYDQQSQSTHSKPVLRKAIELSQHNVYWHCRLIFQLAQIHATEKDYQLASSLLGVGVDYAHIANASYTRILFLLSKGMLLLIDKKYQDVQPVLSQAGHLIDTWSGGLLQRDYLRFFHYFLQIFYYLTFGQTRSAKPLMRVFQMTMQSLTSSEDDLTNGDMFLWLPKEYLEIVANATFMVYSMLAGMLERPLKTIEKTIADIQKLKLVDNKSILTEFQLYLHELTAMARLVMGSKTMAIQEIANCAVICRENLKVQEKHSNQLRTLLGLYAMNMNCFDAAEAQFNIVLANTQNIELFTFVNLNLAIIFIRNKRETDLHRIMDRILPDNLPTTSLGMRAGALFVQGVQAFFESRFQDAKRCLREALKVAHNEDCNRVTCISLVLLGHVFLSIGNRQESLNMVGPALNLASKVPDIHVQLWATAILKDLYNFYGNVEKENEAYQQHIQYSQLLLKEHYQASQLHIHSLIHWTQGPVPAGFTFTPLPSTSNVKQ